MATGEGIIGRHPQLSLFDDLCLQTAAGGAAIAIEGAPGVGKTALVDEFARRGAARGMAVLRTTGTIDERAVPFSGLHLLLHPLHDRIPSLPRPQARALEIAFGLVDGEPPSPFLAGLATLTLLSDAASAQPLLVIADDLHWLDAASRAALLVAARRIGSDPVLVVLMTRRMPDGSESLGVPVIPLPPLAFIEANELLDRRPDHPQGRARRVLLERAAGNPLALVELAADDTDDPRGVSVTGRLERSFADRYLELPRATRLAVLAAAIDETAPPLDVCGVAARVLGVEPRLVWLTPAAEAGLIDRERDAVGFRHPLARSAVVSASAADERAAVLGALVTTYPDESDRTVWWRAELATPPDDALADELDALGTRSLTDPGRALGVLRRAAGLTADPARRADRLLRAAQAAASAGANQTSADLLARAEQDSADRVFRARCAWQRELLPLEQSSLARGDFGPAMAALEELRGAGDEDAVIAGLLHLASIAWNHTVDDRPREAILIAARATGLAEDDPRRLLLTAITEPVAAGDRVEELIRMRGPGTDDDPQTAWLLGFALNLVGEVDSSIARLRRAVDGLREQSSITVLPQALMGLAWDCFAGGAFAEGRAHIAECIALALDADDPGLAAAARTALSLFDALEGTPPDPEAIAGSSPLAALALETQAMRATLTLAEGISAVARGEARAGASILARLADPASPDRHLQFSLVALPDLVDAALASGSTDLARDAVARVEEVHAGWHTPTIVSALGYGRIALGTQAVDAGPLPLPLHQARALLLVGSRLRRAKRIEEARRHLHAALEEFERLGLRRWSSRTRDELRATGERLADEPPSGKHVLTPQELVVAGYASMGLTNREIAERLFLSPRTVATHLHSSYRKLGVIDRGQLSGALGEE